MQAQNTIEPLRLCSLCKEEKPPAEFNRDRRCADGLRAYCRPCSKRLFGRWYAKQADQRPPKPVLPLDGKLCSVCGEFKTLAEFPRAPRYLLGVNSKCHRCLSEYRAAYKFDVKARAKISVSTKRCQTCHTEKDADAFSKNPYHSDGLASRCKECRKNRERRHGPERALQVKQNQYRSLYGVTLEQVEAILQQQNHQCAICRRPIQRFCVDHNHKTNAVRGLLCFRCNSWLAAVEDDEFRKAALAYLERSACCITGSSAGPI